MALALRSEAPGDAAAIRAVHVAAFSTPAEAELVEALRAGNAAKVSEVALLQGRIVGHVLLSPVSAKATLGLAPIGVLPEHQKQGIGSALMRRALERAREEGAGAVVLVGEPAYYRRFGFVPARQLQLHCKWPGTEHAFMALELEAGALGGSKGLVSYHPAFDAF
jgi:putative acetyltransferase